MSRGNVRRRFPAGPAPRTLTPGCPPLEKAGHPWLPTPGGSRRNAEAGLRSLSGTRDTMQQGPRSQAGLQSGGPTLDNKGKRRTGIDATCAQTTGADHPQSCSEGAWPCQGRETPIMITRLDE